MELPFASLHQLCAPLLDDAQRLPPPQREALDRVRFELGRPAGPVPPRTRAAQPAVGRCRGRAVAVPDRRRPVARSVSAQVLAFVARRLQAKSVVMMFAEREPGRTRRAGGPAGSADRGSGDADARALLASVLRGPLGRARARPDRRRDPRQPAGAARAAARLVAGDAGGRLRPWRLPLPSRIEASFRQQRRSAPRRSPAAAARGRRRADRRSDAAVASGRQLGIAAEAAAPPRPPGLLDVGARVVFRHPLLRSAVYRAASADERRSVHARWPRSPIRSSIRIGARGTGRRRRSVPTRTSPTSSSGPRRGRRSAAVSRRRRRSSSVPRLTLEPGRRAARALAAAQAKLAPARPTALRAAGRVAEGRAARRAAPCPAERLRGRSRSPDAEATRPRSCSRRRNASSRSTPRSRVRPTSKRSAAFSPVASAAARACGGGRRRARRTRRPRSRPVRSTCSSTAWRSLHRGLRRRRARRSGRAGRGVRRRRPRRDDIRWLWLPCRIAPDLWDDETWHQLATRRFGSLAMPARSPFFRSRRPTARRPRACR